MYHTNVLQDEDTHNTQAVHHKSDRQFAVGEELLLAAGLPVTPLLRIKNAIDVSTTPMK
jgi:hypothetical protein